MLISDMNLTSLNVELIHHLFNQPCIEKNYLQGNASILCLAALRALVQSLPFMLLTETNIIQSTMDSTILVFQNTEVEKPTIKLNNGCTMVRNIQ